MDNDEWKSSLLQQYPELFEGAWYMFGWPSGWDVLVTKLVKDIAALHDSTKVVQIKSKFAGLRFYVYSASQQANELIRAAEKASFSICEGCGKPGTLREQCGWLATYCDSCNAELMKETSKYRKPEHEDKNGD